MSTKTWLMIVIVAIIGTAVFTKYSYPTIVTKIVTVEKEVIVTHTHIVQAPDGTTTTDITNRDEDVKKIVDTKMASPAWFVTAGLQYEVGKGAAYNFGINKRLLGPIFMGIQGTSVGTVGVQVGATF